MKAACFTVAAMDFFPQKNACFAGGNALNQSIRLTNLGLDCTFLGALGTDDNGDRLYTLLQRSGVNVSLVERIEGNSANNRIVNDSQGERFGEEGAWHGGVYDKYQIGEEQWDIISGFDIWSTHMSCPNFMQTILRKKKNRLCVDYLHLPDAKVLRDTVNSVDIAYVGGCIEMKESLCDLSRHTKALIVLTLGAEGSFCLAGGKSYFQEALKADVVDTTGCGDAFQAGFTYRYYSSGSIEESLYCGAEQGRKAAEHFGGVPW